MKALHVNLPPLHTSQKEVAAHTARFKVLACGRRRQWGKTRLGAALTIGTAIKGGRAWWVGPTYPVASVGWRQIKRLAKQLPGATIREAERIVELPGGGWVQVRSADNPDSLRGEGLDFVVMDECAFIHPDAWREALRPALSDRQGRAMFISTPNGRNWFWDLWARGKERSAGGEWASWQLPTTDNPYIAPSEVEAARQSLPEHIFQQEYLALFVESGANTFSPSWWDGANRYDPHDANLAAIPVGRYILWDTALSEKDGAAYSAALVVDLLPDYRLVVREVWRERMAFPDLVSRITALARKWNADTKLKAVVIEDKASGTSAIQTLAVSTEKWLAKKIVAFMPTGSKEARAAQAAVWAKNGSILLPEPGPAVPWLWAFEEELFSFPQSEAKDQVDVLSMAALYLERYLAAGYNKRFRQEAA